MRSRSIQCFKTGWFVVALIGLVLPPGAKSVRAEVIESQIVEIVPPEKPGDATLVLLSAHGRALRLKDGAIDPQTLDLMRAEIAAGAATGRNDGPYFRFDFSNGAPYDTLHSVEKIDPPTHDHEDDSMEGIIEEPGALNDTYDVGELFRWLKRKGLRRSAQCFHRAYIWAYDAWTQRGIFTNKIFLFFTAKYIREYNYHWWFHVTPYVDTDNGLRTLDPTFTRGPLSERAWTNVFMRNDAYCPTIERYTGYSNHHRDKYCYMRKTTMYYYHPQRVERADENNYVITDWDRVGLRVSQQARP